LNRVAIGGVLVASAALLACSAILGLKEPAIDDTIGDAQQPDGGDAGNGPLQIYAGRVGGITMDNDSIYFAAPANFIIGRVAKDGTSHIDLASGLDATHTFPYGVVVDATDVFWVTTTGLHQCKKTGCSNSPIHLIDDFAADAGDWTIAVATVDDASTVYFSSADTVNGGVGIYSPVTTVLDMATFTACTTDLQDLQWSAGYLYFLCDSGTLGRVSTSTKQIEIFTTPNAPPSPYAMALAGATIYYTQFTVTGSIFSVPTVDDAGSTPVALQQPYPRGIAVDQQYLYWLPQGTTNDGSLVRCKLGQCSGTVTTLQSPLDTPSGVSSDGTYVYYSVFGSAANAANGIYRMVNP